MISELLFGVKPTLWMVALEFAASAMLVLLFATKLSKYADALERSTDISAVWIGAIFLAIVTSLPEAVTSIGSALMQDAMDLGVANLFGSNTFNLFILVVLDGLQGGGPILLMVQSGLLVAAAAGITLMGLAGMAIGFHQHEVAADSAMWVGLLFSAAILVGYVVLSRLTTKELPIPNTADESGAGAIASVYSYSRRRIVVRLGIYSLLLIAVAIWLLRVCDTMAVMPIPVGGKELVLGRTVTGTFLLSAGTSLPELFVCVAALRLGQTNMAVANLLGSNMANMCFVPVMHAVTRNASFYGDVDAPSIMVLTCVAILMTAILMLGLMVRSKRSFMILGWEAVAMLAVYLVGAYLVLRMGLGVGV